MEHLDTRQIIAAALGRVREKMFKANTIEKLMSEKVEDYILIEELPMPVRIGMKTIYIGNFTLQNEHEFFLSFAKLMACVGLKHITMDLLANGMNLYGYMAINKKLYRKMLELIGKTILKHQKYYHEATDRNYRLSKCSLSYFKKHITKEKLLQIFKLMHLYNWDAEKKNFKLLMGSLNSQAGTETYIYSWLRNLAGLMGKFSERQSINVDWWCDEQQNEQEQEAEQKSEVA